MELSCGRVNIPAQRGGGANEGRRVCREAQSRLMRCEIQEGRAQWRILPYELLFQFSSLSNDIFSLKCTNAVIFKRTRNFYFSLSARQLRQGILVSHDCRDWTDACRHTLNMHFGFNICIYTHFMNANCDLHLILL